MSAELIKDIESAVFRVPAEYCTDNETVRAYLAGRIDERKDIVKTIKAFKQPGKDYYKGDAYCVKCKEKREFEGVVKTSDSGRRMAVGKCNECGTKLNRILGKAITSGFTSENVEAAIEAAIRHTAEAIAVEIEKDCIAFCLNTTTDKDKDICYTCRHAEILARNITRRLITK